MDFSNDIKVQQNDLHTTSYRFMQHIQVQSTLTKLKAWQFQVRNDTVQK